MLTAEAILGAEDLKSETIEIPEWGGSVRVRELTAVERNEIGIDFIGPDGQVDASRMPVNLHGRVAAMCLVDEGGKRIFSDADADRLGAKSAVALEPIIRLCFRLSGISAEGVEEVKESSG